VQEILDGDHAVLLAYTTPAEGVVLAPVTNFGLHDRGAGVITVNSSVGAWKKLDRIHRSPQVAVAFHTRAYARHQRPEYVLVQGCAALSPPLADYPSRVIENWERIEPWRELGPLWRRWLRIYALRVEVRITVERVLVWPDLSCAGAPRIQGAPLRDGPPAAQAPPGKGTKPRVAHRRVAHRAARLPNRLLGFVGTDGFPVVAPVQVAGTNERGIELHAPAGLAVSGGRRAGFTAHWFSRGVVGQRQIICTGWIPADGDAGGEDQQGWGASVTYAPHTVASYRMPSSRLVYRLAVGLFTRRRLRRAPTSVRRALGIDNPSG
jgi:hypothetical protein